MPAGRQIRRRPETMLRSNRQLLECLRKRGLQLFPLQSFGRSQTPATGIGALHLSHSGDWTERRHFEAVVHESVSGDSSLPEDFPCGAFSQDSETLNERSSSAGAGDPRGERLADRPVFSNSAASIYFRSLFQGRAPSPFPGLPCDGAAAAAARRRGIATSSERREEEELVRSPLSQTPGPLGKRQGGALGGSALFPRTAQAVLTGIKQSPQKLNLVAAMVRGMRVEDALAQMAVSVKRAAKTVSKVVHSAQANATHNFGLEKDRLVVREAFVGKDRYLHRVRPHGKGKAGKLVHPRCRLTVIVKEMSEEEQTDLARLRLLKGKGTRMSRAEGKLVPHRLLETQWSRKRVVDTAESGEPWES